MDELDIDICITSSQKGLNIPPGLSILFFNKKLCDYKYNHKGYYWDFDDNFLNLQRGQTPFSPATILFLQLNARLRQLQAEGGEQQNIYAVRHRATVFRILCAEYGWNIPAENPSFAITGFFTNDDEHRRVFNELLIMDELIELPFEDSTFYCFSEYDKVLRLVYGNYMELLPESERFPHLSSIRYYSLN